jgi:hypothetical protein
MAVPPRDPQANQCRKQALGEHKGVLKMYKAARTLKRIDPAEAAQFRTMERQLKVHSRQAAKDGLTLDECRQLRGEIADIKTTLNTMAQTR